MSTVFEAMWSHVEPCGAMWSIIPPVSKNNPKWPQKWPQNDPTQTRCVMVRERVYINSALHMKVVFTLYGAIWSHLEPFGAMWSIIPPVSKHNPKWPKMTQNDPTQTRCAIVRERVYINSALHMKVVFTLCEAIWSHLEPFGAIWSHLEPFGANAPQQRPKMPKMPKMPK